MQDSRNRGGGRTFGNNTAPVCYETAQRWAKDEASSRSLLWRREAPQELGGSGVQAGAPQQSRKRTRRPHLQLLHLQNQTKPPQKKTQLQPDLCSSPPPAARRALMATHGNTNPTAPRTPKGFGATFCAGTWGTRSGGSPHGQTQQGGAARTGGGWHPAPGIIGIPQLSDAGPVLPGCGPERGFLGCRGLRGRLAGLGRVSACRKQAAGLGGGLAPRPGSPRDL